MFGGTRQITRFLRAHHDVRYDQVQEKHALKVIDRPRRIKKARWCTGICREPFLECISKEGPARR